MYGCAVGYVYLLLLLLPFSVYYYVLLFWILLCILNVHKLELIEIR